MTGASSSFHSPTRNNVLAAHGHPCLAGIIVASPGNGSTASVLLAKLIG